MTAGDLTDTHRGGVYRVGGTHDVIRVDNYVHHGSVTLIRTGPRIVQLDAHHNLDPIA